MNTEGQQTPEALHEGGQRLNLLITVIEGTLAKHI